MFNISPSRRGKNDRKKKMVMHTELWLSQSNTQHIHDLYLLFPDIKKQEYPSLTSDLFLPLLPFLLLSNQKTLKILRRTVTFLHISYTVMYLKCALKANKK